jgi:Flp pilus assembly protein TadD
MKRRLTLLPLLLLCGFAASVVLLQSQCTGSSNQDSVSLFLNHHDSAKYVGLQACAGCHQDKVDSFLQTGMGRSFGFATAERSAATFHKQAPVYDAWNDLYYEPFLEGNQLRLREYRLNGKDTVFSRTETLHYIIGSGHHTNSHLIARNGYLFQAPLTFYVQEGKWDLPPGYEQGNNIRFSRKIDMECMSCHNAMPEMEAGSQNKFRQIPQGIDCERCHGPGSVHVAQKKAGILVDTRTATDYSIVNPAKLPWSLQIDVCQRCHLQGNNVLRPGKTFEDFRPGMRLSDVFEVYMPKHEGGDYFVMAGHAERLQQSACFIKSNQGSALERFDRKLNFTCITCHNPHVSVRQTNTARFNQACVNCHNTAAGKKGCSEQAAALQKQQNNCVACHMPPSDTRDIPHVTVHDHYIRKPSAEKKGNPVITGLYAVNNPKPDAAMQTRAYITWYEKFERNNLYAERAKSMVERQDVAVQIHYLYATAQYAKLLQRATDMKADACSDAWTAYRIAVAYDETGNLTPGLDWYARAAALQPAHLDFQSEYAKALLRLKQYDDAAQLLGKILKEDPQHEHALVAMAMVQLARQNVVAARAGLLKALSLNPDNMQALENLRNLYQQAGDLPKATAMQQRMDAVRLRKQQLTSRASTSTGPGK